MARLHQASGLRIANTVFFTFMVLANIYIEALPLNNVTVNEVSKAHDTIITPPDFSFMIWGVIYLWLFLFILFQFGIFNTKSEANNPDIIYKLGGFFIFSSILNVGWIVAWHYEYLVLAFLLIFAIWITLIIAYGRMISEIRDFKDRFFVQFPFGMYLSWLTAATLVNAMALLTYYNPDLLAIPASYWICAALAVIFGMSEYYVIKHKDFVYGLTSLWVLSGLLYRYFGLMYKEGNGMFVFLLLAVLSVVLLFSLLIAGWLQHNKPEMPQSSRNRDFYD